MMKTKRIANVEDLTLRWYAYVYFNLSTRENPFVEVAKSLTSCVCDIIQVVLFLVLN